MEFISHDETRSSEIVALITATFAASEGDAEGQLVGHLAANILATVPKEDLLAFMAVKADRVVGAILFTRIRYPEDTRRVFLLAPVAISTEHQGQGVGQELLLHGRMHLRGADVDVALTYGDINFYAKVGFTQITEAQAKAPLPLQYPTGWLGQSLTGDLFAPRKGPSRCAEALNDPAYW